MTSWLFLGAAIACEVAGTTMMKLSDSLSKWIWIPPMLTAYVLSLLGLALALKTIEAGVAYAVWAATGTLLIATIGIVYFDESVTWLKIASIGFVILGVTGLYLSDAAH